MIAHEDRLHVKHLIHDNNAEIEIAVTWYLGYTIQYLNVFDGKQLHVFNSWSEVVVMVGK